MTCGWLRIRSFVWLLAIVLLVACGGGGAPPAPVPGFSECALAGDAEKLIPLVACTFDDSAARTVVFGYRNDGPTPAMVPSGTSSNRYSIELDPRASSGAIRPPSAFLPGTHAAAFSVTYLSFLGDLAWRLGPTSVSSAGAPRCTESRVGGDVVLTAPATDESPAVSITVSKDPTRAIAVAIDPTLRPLDGLAVGETEGSLAVTGDGSAAHTIPIVVPPGRAGMAPELALNYGSRGGNGPLGVGWSLAGLSQISRCPSTRPVALPIRWNPSDKFCLDGDELVGDLAPGMSPLHDPYTRVLIIASDALGPTEFTAEMKNGRILRFGGSGATLEGNLIRHSSDGIDSGGPATRVRYAWLLSEVKDRPGNAIKYWYSDSELPSLQGCQEGVRPCAAYEKVLSAITYTHRPSGNGAIKRIELEYDETRPDGEIAWVSGLPLKRTKRLTKILVRGPTSTTAPATLRTYSLEYAIGSLSGRSLLASVQECDGGGACRAATTFEYEEGARTFSARNLGRAGGAGAPDGAANSNLIVADFTGDGLDDLLYKRSGKWFLRRNSSSPGSGVVSFDLETSLLLATDSERRTTLAAFPADVDHDGKLDLVFPFVELYTSTHPQCFGSTYRVLQYKVLNWSNFTFQFDGGGPVTSIPTRHQCGDELSHAFHADLDGDDRLNGVTVSEGGSDAPWSGRCVQAFCPDGLCASPTCPTAGGPLIVAPAPVAFGPLAAPIGGSRSWSFMVAKDGRYSVANGGEGFPTPFVPGRDISFGDLNLDGMADALMRAPRGSDSTLVVATGAGFRRQIIGNPPLEDGFPTFWPNEPHAIRFDYFQDGRGAWLVDIDPGSRRLGTPLLRPRGLLPPDWQPSPPLASAGSITTDPIFFPLARVTDANGDGLDDLLVIAGGDFRLYVRDGRRADLLKRVRTGLGDTTRVSYAGVLAGYPDPFLANCGDRVGVACGTRGVTVVSNVERHAGTSSRRSTSYQFLRASTDFERGEFLGFDVTSEKDDQTGATTVKQFARRAESFVQGSYRVFPLANALTSVETRVPLENGRTILSRATYVYQLGTAHDALETSITEVRPPGSASIRALPRTVRRLTQEIDTASSAVRAVLHDSTSTFVYDRFGNTSEATYSVPGVGRSDKTTNAWRVDVARWLIAQPTATTESSSVATPLLSGSDSQTTTYDPDPATGLIRSVRLMPSAGAELDLSIEFQRDGAGNVLATIARDTLGSVRRTDVSYDEFDGTFPVRSIDNLGYATTAIYHPGLGVLVESTDANGVRRRFRYDGFSSLRRVLEPICPTVDFTGTLCGGARTVITEGPPTIAGAAFSVAVTRAGFPPRVTNYDFLGRAVREDTQNFDGKLKTSLTSYDPVHLDLPRSVSQVLTPATGPVGFFLARTTTFSYDRSGRIVRRVEGDGSVSEWSYDGLVTTTFDPLGAESAVERDVLGRIARSTDVLVDGGLGPFVPPGPSTDVRTSFRYGPFSRLARIADAKGNQTSFSYDSRGRRRVTQDPNSGRTELRWNAFGEVVARVDAMDRVTSYAYDSLGRLIGEKAGDGTACYQYDGASGAIGKLTASTRLDGVGESRVKTVQSYGFDPLGRVRSVHQVVGDGPDLAFEYDYDTVGRLNRITYPQIETARLVVGYEYNSSGYLDRAVDLTTSGAAPLLWRADETNATGQLTKETFGNGVVTNASYYPATGRLDRLTATGPSGSVVEDLRHTWYRDGRLQSRVDTSTASEPPQADLYTYDTLKRLTTWAGRWGGVRYDYDVLGNLSRRVTTTGSGRVEENFQSGSVGFPLPGGGGSASTPIHAVVRGPGEAVYTYNDAGDQLTAPGRTIEWTSFHLPRRIIADTVSAFVYDAAGVRVRKTTDEGLTTTYAGGLFEYRQSAGARQAVFSIAVSGRVIAQICRTINGGSVASETLFFTNDHLGSPRAMTNAAGALVGTVVHEPFGRRIEPGNPRSTAPPVASLNRGFTGHEHDDEHALINMRGRIFDPTVSRFLSADPIVGTAGQHLNQYSYVQNDPLNAVDSTGLCRDTPHGCVGSGGSSSGGGPYYSSASPESSGETDPGPRLKPPESPPTPTTTAPRPGSHTPYAPLNGGVGAISPFGLGGFIGFRMPTLGGGYNFASGAWKATIGAVPNSGPPIVSTGGSAETPRGIAGPRYAAGMTSTETKGTLDREWVDYNAWYNPNRLVTVYGYPAAKYIAVNSVAVGTAGVMIGVAGLTAGGVWATTSGVGTIGGMGGVGFGAGAAASTAAIDATVAAEAGELGAAAGSTLGDKGGGFIDPSVVRFTQDSVKSTFRNGVDINATIDTLRGPAGARAAAEFPPIRLVERGGQLFTLDNRRLLVFSEAGRRVPFVMATPAEIAKEFPSKFTTGPNQGFGIFIMVRP